MKERNLNPPDNPCEYCKYWDDCFRTGQCIKKELYENYKEQQEEWWAED